MSRTLEAYWDLRIPLREGTSHLKTNRQGIAPSSEQELLQSLMDMHVSNLINRHRIGYRARISKTPAPEVSARQGELLKTSRDLDLAIEGEGFFQVSFPNGKPGYTRAGRMSLTLDGHLTASRGYAVRPSVRIPKGITRLFINHRGIISGFDPRKPTEMTYVGHLVLVRFTRSDALVTSDGVVFQSNEESGEPIAANTSNALRFSRIRQGFLENSNVDIEAEVGRLRGVLAAYKTKTSEEE